MREIRTAAEIISAYEGSGFKVAARSGKGINGACPKCGGKDRFWIREGGKAEVVVGCNQCKIDIVGVLEIFFPRDDRPPVRHQVMKDIKPPTEEQQVIPFGVTLQQLADHFFLPTRFLTSTMGWSDSTCFIKSEERTVPSVRIPYYDMDGTEIGAKHRVRISGSDKYRAESGSRAAMLYGQQFIAPELWNGALHVVEGESDTATLISADIGSTVGVPGSSAVAVIRPEHVAGVDVVYVVRESDAAGAKFPQSIADRLREIDSSAAVRVVTMPEGIKDPTEWAQSVGDRQEFKERFIRACRYSAGLRPSKIERSRLRLIRDHALDVFPPLPWIIPELLPPGLALLVGGPKSGKSWMMAQVALGVSAGRNVWRSFPDAVKSEVLMIDLEQVLGARTQARLSWFRAHEDPGYSFLTDQWPTLDQGGLEEFDSWLTEHPRCKLITVDVWSNIKPSDGKGNSYDAEYRWLKNLRNLFLRHDACLLLAHHDNKGQSNDVTVVSSGTKALTGAANSILWLQRTPTEGRGTLKITGREVMSRELIADFDVASRSWDVWDSSQ